ncbi:MAG: TSUP family transporter [Planctomycetota bacterium]|nr:TSUP family transporter [Planctomycetota bacterium]
MELDVHTIGGWAVVGLAALLAGGLTLFSGFGLGTLLMPVLALFVPVELAVAATAVVHLANNLFKLALLGKHADKRVALRFGLPAVLAAFAGAALLEALSSHMTPVFSHAWFGAERDVSALALVIAGVIAAFAAMELWPRFDTLAFHPRWLPVGGIISGFFGGLSGHQGALRSAFLTRAGLERDAFLGTGVVIAVAVDLARLTIYLGAMVFVHEASQGAATREAMMSTPMLVTLAVACAGAFVGSFVGAKLVKKVTLLGLKRTIGVLLIVLAAAMATGLV